MEFCVYSFILTWLIFSIVVVHSMTSSFVLQSLLHMLVIYPGNAVLQDKCMKPSQCHTQQKLMRRYIHKVTHNVWVRYSGTVFFHPTPTMDYIHIKNACRPAKRSS